LGAVTVELYEPGTTTVMVTYPLTNPAYSLTETATASGVDDQTTFSAGGVRPSFSSSAIVTGSVASPVGVLMVGGTTISVPLSAVQVVPGAPGAANPTQIVTTSPFDSKVTRTLVQDHLTGTALGAVTVELYEPGTTTVTVTYTLTNPASALTETATASGVNDQTTFSASSVNISP
jgi:hypothetical protein